MEKHILQQLDPKILGGRLQEARKACGFTQQVVADRQDQRRRIDRAQREQPKAARTKQGPSDDVDERSHAARPCPFSRVVLAERFLAPFTTSIGP